MSGQFAKEFFDALAGRRTHPSVVLEVVTDDGRKTTVTLEVGSDLEIVNVLQFNGGGADIKVERKSNVKVMSING